jgi:hypothetical protein
MRLTLEEYSKHFKMSKEMINSKLRSKRLNYIIEDGVTYIIVTRSSLDKEKRSEIHTEQKENKKAQEVTSTTANNKTKTTVAMVLGLYQKENQQLKDKIVQLEAKIDKLIDDKEQMLRDEMAKIEQVYLNKDEQLKNVLELMNSKMIAQSTSTIHEVEPLEVSDDEEQEDKKEIIELKNYLKSLDIEVYQRKIIKKRFLADYGKDIRIIKQNGKLYLDFSKYDYSDLLEY